MFDLRKGGIVRMLFFVSLALALFAACGGDDDGGSDPGDSDGNGAENGDQNGDGEVEMVSLASLGLNLPFELSYDPPVPSDATVSNAIEREASDTLNGGYDLTLSTSASYEDMQPVYDEYMAGMEFNTPFPESQSWSGRRAEGEPGITIAVLPNGSLNIAEILDN